MPRVVVFDEAGPPEVLRIVDEPVGEPAAGEVRVKIKAIGVNRLDQIVRSGTVPQPIGPTALPHARLGCEGTGTIDALGPGVEGFSVGDPVIITAVPRMDVNGTYAEYTVVPAGTVIHRPAELNATHAAAMWVAYSTAYGALVEKAAVRPGDHVLITAASSSVGLAAIQVANQIGAVPVAVTRRTSKKAGLLAAGAAAAIATDQEDVNEVVRRYTDGAGADIILDFVMGPGLPELAKAAKRGGILLTAGWLEPQPAPIPMTWPLTIIGYAGFEHTTDSTVVRRIVAFLTAGLRTGALQPHVSKVFDLDDIVAAHHYLEQGERFGKIVVTV